MENNIDFFEKFSDSFKSKEFVKLTLSKPFSKSTDLRNIYVRLVKIKNVSKLSLTYRYKTKDEVKNFSIEEAITELTSLLKANFRIATLFTIKGDFILKISKKGIASLLQQHASFKKPALEENHDREKTKRTEHNDYYLNLLGISDATGIIIPKMSDKYRQINKYLEIIEGLVKSIDLPEEIHIVDMGSGKGYLTFALYDFLTKKLKLKVKMLGIEMREDLVDKCNEVAEKCGFDNLKFEKKSIQEYEGKHIDILIALHACDTATDDAISKGIVSNADLIICAPCCHKQIRQQVKGKEQESPILKYGIFKERQFEMVTDTIRALIMEKNQYQTKIFEFVSNEHTRKNIMMVASKSDNKEIDTSIDDKIDAIKKEFGIEYHYLEKQV